MKFGRYHEMGSLFGNQTFKRSIIPEQMEGKTKVSVQCGVSVEIETDNKILEAILTGGENGKIHRLR